MQQQQQPPLPPQVALTQDALQQAAPGAPTNNTPCSVVEEKQGKEVGDMEWVSLRLRRPRLRLRRPRPRLRLRLRLRRPRL